MPRRRAAPRRGRFIERGVTLIEFPCRYVDCPNMVKVDDNHPQFAELEITRRASCNACLKKTISPS